MGLRAGDVTNGRGLPFPSPALAGHAVSLRAWEPADAAAVPAAFADPVFRRHWAGSIPETEAEVRRELAEMEAGRLRGERIDLAMAGDGGLLGGISLFDVDRAAARATVGYWLAPEARGRGTATGAVRLLAAWAFGVLGLERLELTCGPENVASQRVAERCGFTLEARLRAHTVLHGERRDTLVYGLLAGELR